MRQVNFNLIAPFYDFLARLVFGSDLKKAQTIFFNQIKANDKVLIVGGGTGWILEELNQLNKPITVVYVEPSAKMMVLSKTRTKVNNLSIEYLQAPLLDIDITNHFDVICTFFFLDLFEKQTVLQSIDRIDELLKPNGKWLFADFVLTSQSPVYHKITVKMMLHFFRYCSNIESKKLLDYQQLIQEKGFEVIENKQWKKGLIQSTVFHKQ